MKEHRKIIGEEICDRVLLIKIFSRLQGFDRFGSLLKFIRKSPIISILGVFLFEWQTFHMSFAYCVNKVNNTKEAQAHLTEFRFICNSNFMIIFSCDHHHTLCKYEEKNDYFPFTE